MWLRQIFLFKVIECKMCILWVCWICLHCSSPWWGTFFIYETNWLDSNHNENVLFFCSLGRFGLFPTSVWPSYGTKDQAMFEKRQWWKLVYLCVDSLFCNEHNKKQPTFGKSLGYMAAKFMHFDNGTQTFSSQICIKVTYVFNEKIFF